MNLPELEFSSAQDYSRSCNNFIRIVVPRIPTLGARPAQDNENSRFHAQTRWNAEYSV